MDGGVEAVVFDWAGTTVDYGCFAPVGALLEAFRREGLEPTLAETRAPMGLPKREHVKAMLAGERLRRQFVKQFRREPGEEDVDRVYQRFEPSLMEVLHRHGKVIPGVLETVGWLRDRGIPIGSTTGYTAAMMEMVAPLAREGGYWPDCMATPEEAGGMGRPWPYMLWRNLERLGVKHARRVMKVGDTAADMEEGVNGGCVAVGVLLGSSELGLREEEAAGMDKALLRKRMDQAERRFREAGAHRVIGSIRDLPGLIGELEREWGRKGGPQAAPAQ